MRLLFRWIPRLIFCAVIVFMIAGVLAYWLNKPGETPSIEDAPWAIQTYSNDALRVPSRIYYAATVEIREDGTPVATTYWTYNGQKYKKHKGEIVFTESEYGIIGIARRTK